MKKILTALASFSLIVTSTILVVSCKTDTSKENVKKPNVDSTKKEDKKENGNSKKPKYMDEMPQSDQPKNEREDNQNPGLPNNNKDNIFSSTEDERPYIKGYSEWINKSKTDDVQHFINPYDPNEILILGYTKSMKGKKTEFVLKQIPKNINKVPNSLPRNITSLEGTFKDNINETIDGIENWDTSRITNMNKTFYGATKFNGDITKWITNNVEDMSYMFFNAEGFKRDLSRWSVPKSFYSNTFDKYSGIKDKKEWKPQFKK
uniref:Lipoprotein n=1 Tax=Mycoplasma feriruminatoris TaxID=1179777 RepID=A0A654IJB5_9MOLU|nr:hypothetical protein MF5295_00706 [Mycoplasma feriruminatoris]